MSPVFCFWKEGYSKQRTEIIAKLFLSNALFYFFSGCTRLIDIFTARFLQDILSYLYMDQRLIEPIVNIFIENGMLSLLGNALAEYTNLR